MPRTVPDVRVVPANDVPFDDVLAVFGERGYPSRCLCQRFKVPGWLWRDTEPEEREEMLRVGTGCDDPDATQTSGLVAYLGDEPVAWVAVEPRTAYPKLFSPQFRIPWKDRHEDRDDDTVWAVTCFTVRAGHRGRGLMYPLASAAAEHARRHGATAVEAYPMLTEPGQEVTWGEVFVGTAGVFAAAGFERVSHPTKRRVVMRLDF
ncbi:GNAT family N-acetyltransferase [Aquipuribacter nitratireducens]|uniref:GNAT family N-acetyltransferase n=1 Tax=Aquipuribacter nitratireducens TaxID=650104 RepID=A0ABW0GM39_9MICO